VAVADYARRRIESDPHDGAQQRLIAPALKVRTAMDEVPAGLDGLAARLCDVGSGLTAVLEELREVSHGIHPAILSSGGPGAAMKALARRSAAPVTLDVAIEADVPETVEVAAYCVRWEAGR
jgi:signal transduction histidine kinase